MKKEQVKEIRVIFRIIMIVTCSLNIIILIAFKDWSAVIGWVLAIYLLIFYYK